jgi:hypothetical protein
MSAWVSGFRESRRDSRRSHPVLVALAAVVLVLVGVNQLHGLLPSLHNPFATRTVDRSQPVLLKSLTDLRTYEASQANLQVVVDLKDETSYVPSFLKGKETLFVAAGSVSAGVDFSHLDSSSMVITKDHKGITITLPHATLGETVVDPDNSYVASQHKGLLDRVGSLVGSSGSDAKLYQTAKSKMAAQAAGDPSITQRAEDNTRAMLATMLASLDFTQVTVDFA